MDEILDSIVIGAGPTGLATAIAHNTETFETNVPGVYLAGSVVGGRMNAEVFIENGRLHGEAIVKAIAAKL